MTIAITGASGHVGGNLVRELLRRGERVRIMVHRDTAAVDGLAADTVRGDLLNVRSLVDLVQGADMVFHLAASISIDGGQDGRVRTINVEGTRNVVEACVKSKVKRLVHFSSIHAICQYPRDRTIDETWPAAGEGRCHDYDLTKAEGEKIVMQGVEQGLDAVVVNPTGIIGPHDYKPSPMGQVLLNLFRRRFPALVEGGFNWVDVRDVVQGAILAAEKGRRGERYLLPGHYKTLRELGRIMEKATGVRPPRFVSPLWLALLGAPFMTAFNKLVGGRPLYTTESIRTLEWNPNISSAKAETELGYRRRPIEETVADTFQWFKEAGRIP
jgi:dihydroflavonol-4-reductase